MPALPTRGLSRNIPRLFGYSIRYAYDSLRYTVYPKERISLRGLRHMNCQSPSVILCGLRHDLSTCLRRMARRIETLPNRELIPGLPALELTQTACWVLNTRTLCCIEDTKTFADLHPEATDFDLELFQFGWQAGVESDYHMNTQSKAVNRE